MNTKTTTQALLARWKAAKGYDTDAAAGRALKVTRAAVNNWQMGVSHANPASAARMALDLNLDALAILAAIEADRARDPESRRVWARYGKGIFMALALTLASTAPVPKTAQAAQMGDVSPHYAKRRRNLREPARASW